MCLSVRLVRCVELISNMYCQSFASERGHVVAGHQQHEIEYPPAHGLLPGRHQSVLHQVCPESRASRNARRYFGSAGQLNAL